MRKGLCCAGEVEKKTVVESSTQNSERARERQRPFGLLHGQKSCFRHVPLLVIELKHTPILRLHFVLQAQFVFLIHVVLHIISNHKLIASNENSYYKDKKKKKWTLS